MATQAVQLIVTTQDVVDTAVDLVMTSHVLPTQAAEAVLAGGVPQAALIELATAGLADRVADGVRRRRLEPPPLTPAQLEEIEQREAARRAEYAAEQWRAEQERRDELARTWKRGQIPTRILCRLHKAVYCPDTEAWIRRHTQTKYLGDHDYDACLAATLGEDLKTYIKRMAAIPSTLSPFKRNRMSKTILAALQPAIDRARTRNSERLAEINKRWGSNWNEYDQVLKQQMQDALDTMVGEALNKIVLACGSEMKPLRDFTLKDVTRWERTARHRAESWARRAEWFKEASDLMHNRQVSRIMDLPSVEIGRLARRASAAWQLP